MAARSTYVFGRFRLSGDGTMLMRGATRIPLAPKPLRTLLTLVERAGDVVRKEELVGAVWPDSFVEDTGLTRNISVVRQALGEDGDRFIVTVARLGYRFTAPVERVEAEPGLRQPAVARADGRCPVVGRAAELEMLREAFGRAAARMGRIVGVTGEPGIGKTTTVDSFLSEIGECARIGRGYCSERLAGAEPHLPILEALDELIASDEKLRHLLSVKAPTWYRHVAPAAQPGAEEAIDQRSARTPERLMRELTTFFDEAASDKPLVLVVEDLHWTDVSSVDVLAHLAPRLCRLRVLVIVTYRNHELSLREHPFVRVRAELIARGQLQEIAVSLLTKEEVREYVLAVLLDDSAACDVPGLVFQKTEGNPLFMADLVRYLQNGDRAGGRTAAVDIPDSLRALIDRTLLNLEPEARNLATVAALQGYDFDSATLTRVTDSKAADTENLLRRLETVHALVARQREALLPDGTLTVGYRFVHVLYQDALLESIVPSKRVEMARRIAEALLSLHAGRIEHIAGQLATLFETSRDFWQASEHLLTASRNATKRFAFHEAIDLATRGLRCLDATGSHDRPLRRREMELTFARLVPVASVEGYASAEAERISTRLVELGESLDDASATAAALSATWMIRIVRGECAAAKEAGIRLVALAEASNDDVLLMNAHMHAQIACHHLGEFRLAEEHSTAAVALGPRVSHAERRMMMFDPITASLAESSRNAWITGRLARAVIDADAAVSIGCELRHPDSLAFALVFHGWLHGYRGDWPTCLASTEAGMATARESDSVQTLAWNRCVHGWALAHSGQIGEGASELLAGIEASAAIMGQVALPQFYALMAEVLLLRRDVLAAKWWVQRAIALMNANADLYFAADLYRLAAICEVESNAPESAIPHLLTSLDIARSQCAKLFELRAALEMAKLNAHGGRAAVKAALSDFPEPEPWDEILRAHRLLAHNDDRVADLDAR